MSHISLKLVCLSQAKFDLANSSKYTMQLYRMKSVLAQNPQEELFQIDSFQEIISQEYVQLLFIGASNCQYYVKRGNNVFGQSREHISKLSKIMSDFWCCGTRKDKDISWNVFSSNFQFVHHDSFLSICCSKYRFLGIISNTSCETQNGVLNIFSKPFLRTFDLQ